MRYLSLTSYAEVDLLLMRSKSFAVSLKATIGDYFYDLSHFPLRNLTKTFA